MTELNTRCEEKSETNFTISMLQNNFKKCISECKHTAITIKTVTKIKCFQEDKGYGAWFNLLFPIVQSRDSCRPDVAVEPSTSSCSTGSTSSSASIEPEVDDQHDLHK